MKNLIFFPMLIAFLTGCYPIDNSEYQIACSSVNANLLSGDIAKNSSRCDWDLTNTLFLFSKGGDLESAIKISNAIKLAGTKTQAVGQCDQECLLLLSAGSFRSMCNNSVLGLNQFKSSDELEKILMFYDDDPRVDGDLMREILTEDYEYQMYMLPHLAQIAGLVDYVIPCEPE